MIEVCLILGNVPHATRQMSAVPRVGDAIKLPKSEWSDDVIVTAVVWRWDRLTDYDAADVYCKRMGAVITAPECKG